MKIVITESQYRFLVENIEIIDDILDKMGCPCIDDIKTTNKKINQVF